jgi:hypothetical protein
MGAYPDDVRYRPARRIDARAVIIIYDFSVQPPQEIGLNSSDAMEWLSRDPKRYSLTAVPAPQIEPKATTAGQVVNLVAAAGGGAAFAGFWLLQISTQTKFIVFSPDYIEIQSRGRGDWVPTTPSA